jgi:hypothetical protein
MSRPSQNKPIKELWESLKLIKINLIKPKKSINQFILSLEQTFYH